MRAARRAAIAAATGAQRWGVVLGTLGRQGNPRAAASLERALVAHGATVTRVLLSEVTPPKLASLGHVDAWVQVACPRLSIDWGEGFERPTLTPYEALVALGEVPGWWQTDRQEGGGSSSSSGGGGRGSCGAAAGQDCGRGGQGASNKCGSGGAYPMDYYAKDGGRWNSSYHKGSAAVGEPVVAWGK
jgi:2-(3-amino-3-carboxypropyl)histidine synthase